MNLTVTKCGCRWWKDSNIAKLVSYVRDRHVEGYLWVSGVYYEPQYSRVRIFVAKLICMITVINDTYDAYATYEESTLLNDAIQRWEASASDRLPKYMHVIYNTLLSLYEDMEKEVRDEGRSYSIDSAKDAMKELSRCYYKELGRLKQDYVPSFEEHIETSSTSIAAPVTLRVVFAGIETIGSEVFDWLESKPICVKYCGVINRLMNDVAGHKFELERKHAATSVQCYMAQYGVSEEEAVKELCKKVENAWKGLNDECLSIGVVSKDIVMQIHKFTRAGYAVYKLKVDWFTHSKGDMEAYITLLFIDPISDSK